MTPSAKELADGQKACERLERYQRTRSFWDLISFFLIVGGVSAWNAFERDGWKAALGTGILWSILTAIGAYQLQRQKKRAAEDAAFLANLKARYGENVYADIQKNPHSLRYILFQKRFPPFNRQSVTLP